MSYLHPAEVLEFWTEDLTPLEPIKEFCDYVYRTFIDENSSSPPVVWADYSASITRTTNACESSNAKLNGSFCSSHPNIFLLMNVLLELQCGVYALTYRVKRRSEALMKEHDVGAIITRREIGGIDRLEYVRRLSYKFLPPTK